MSLYYQLTRHSGVDVLFRSVEMSIHALYNDHPFHLHAEGPRGTGKTTILRAAKSMLPPITRIKGCIYNCQPDAPHCPIHRGLSSQKISEIGSEVVPRPFLEISHSAKVGSVVGSIDLAKLTDQHNCSAALLPGTIPLAHRGVIFIDEINRLADISPELADVLLDVMGTKPGRIQIEEPGIPTVELPVTVSIWAASNPDEDPGPLSQIRRQLADRFDLAVPVNQPDSYQSVFEIIKKRSIRESRRMGEHGPLLTKELAGVDMSDDMRNVLAMIYVDFRLESLRAIEALEMAMRLEALLDNREAVVFDHLKNIVPLVLGHRTDAGTIQNILAYIERLQNRDCFGHHIGAGEPALSTPMSKKNVCQSSRWRQWLKEILGKISISSVCVRKNDTANLPNHTQNSGSASTVIRPTEAPISAPPAPAIPLAQLSDEQLVTTDQGKHI